MINNELIEKDILDIKNYLLNSSLIKEYLNLKNIVNNQYYKNKINEMNFYKKCSKNINDNKEYLKIKKELEEDPILNNFESIQKEVNDLLNEIKDSIIIGK